MQAERAWLQAGVSAAGGSDGDGHSGSRHSSRCSAVELAQGQTGSEEPQGCQAAPAGQAAGRHRLPGGPGARCCKHHFCVKYMETSLRQTPQIPGVLLNVVWRSLVASMPVVHCLLRLLELGLARQGAEVMPYTSLRIKLRLSGGCGVEAVDLQFHGWRARRRAWAGGICGGERSAAEGAEASQGKAQQAAEPSAERRVTGPVHGKCQLQHYAGKVDSPCYDVRCCQYHEGSSVFVVQPSLHTLRPFSSICANETSVLMCCVILSLIACRLGLELLG